MKLQLGHKMRPFHNTQHFCSTFLDTHCICEINCLALDGLNLNTVHQLSSKEKKYQQSQDSDLGLLGEKLRHPTAHYTLQSVFEKI